MFDGHLRAADVIGGHRIDIDHLEQAPDIDGPHFGRDACDGGLLVGRPDQKHAGDAMRYQRLDGALRLLVGVGIEGHQRGEVVIAGKHACPFGDLGLQRVGHLADDDAEIASLGAGERARGEVRLIVELGRGPGDPLPRFGPHIALAADRQRNEAARYAGARGDVGKGGPAFFRSDGHAIGVCARRMLCGIETN